MADARTRLDDLRDVAHTMLRVVAGLMVMQHGLQKLFGMLGGEQEKLASLQGFGGVLETFGGFLVAIGLVARPAAFLLAGEMAAAYFMVHYPRNFFPILNRGELAATLCFVFFYIFAGGAGPHSIDAALRRRRAPRAA